MTEKLREGGFLISKIKQVSGRVFNRKLKSYRITDVNTAQGRIIFSLWNHDDIPINELARQTALGKTTLTSMLTRLEDTGYIIRKEDRNDKRTARICLTGKSRSLERKYEAVSKEMTDLFYQGLTERQIDTFEETLRHILTNLVDYEAQRSKQ